jgi:hypothetical protein
MSKLSAIDKEDPRNAHSKVKYFTHQIDSVIILDGNQVIALINPYTVLLASPVILLGTFGNISSFWIMDRSSKPHLFLFFKTLNKHPVIGEFLYIETLLLITGPANQMC